MKKVDLGDLRGDIVIFGQYGGNEIKLDGEDFLILGESDIFGVIQ